MKTGFSRYNAKRTTRKGERMRNVTVGLVAILLASTAWGQETLDLSGQGTTDEVLAESVKRLTNLKELSLRNTQVTDAGLVHLKRLTNLKFLWLHRTQISDTGILELRKALPNCKIGR
jgi:hypothetical protein